MRDCARILTFLLLSVLLPSAAGAAQEAVAQEWLIPAEVASFEATPDYETLAFLRKLQPRFPEMYLGFYGSSGEGRPMPFVIVSKEKAFTGRRARKN